MTDQHSPRARVFAQVLPALLLAVTGSSLAQSPSTAHCAAATAQPDAASFAQMRQRVLHPQDGDVVIVAHRACHAWAPENSPAAVDACWRIGVPVIENDVMRTKDGALIVFHDPTTTRMTGVEGTVAQMTLEELRQLRLLERQGGEGAFATDMPITTLEEYFEAIRHKVLVNFEIKARGEAFVSAFNESVALARQMGVLDHLVFKIPDVYHHGRRGDVLPLAMIDRAPDVQLLPIIWESDDASLATRLDEVEPFAALGYEFPAKTEGFLQQVGNEPRLANRPRMGLALWDAIAAGLTDEKAMQAPAANWGRMIALGANWVMTDRPEALQAYLDASGQRHCFVAGDDQ